MSKYKIPEWVRKYVTIDVKTVGELLDKYSKTYNTRDKEYHNAMLEHHTEYLEKCGYDFVNCHDSVTGYAVAILKD